MSADWQPRPDPAVHDTRRAGLRPHRHPPSTLHPWVFLQEEVWVDYWGNEQQIDLMAGDYARNVIAFCEQRAALIWVLIARESIELLLDHVGTPKEERFYTAALSADPPSISSFANADAVGWLHTLPLLRAPDSRLQSVIGESGDAGWEGCR